MKRQETAKVEEAEAEAEAEAEPGKEQNKSGVGHSQKMADAKMKKKFADDLELASQLLLNAVRERDQLQENFLLEQMNGEELLAKEKIKKNHIPCNFCNFIFISQLLFGKDKRCPRCYLLYGPECNCTQCLSMRRRKLVQDIESRAVDIKMKAAAKYPQAGRVAARTREVLDHFDFRMSQEVETMIMSKEREQKISLNGPRYRPDALAELQDIRNIPLDPMSKVLTEEEEVRAFFGRINLDRFSEKIIAHGWNSLDKVTSMLESDFTQHVGMPARLARRAHAEVKRRFYGHDVCSNVRCGRSQMSYERVSSRAGHESEYVARCPACGWSEVPKSKGMLQILGAPPNEIQRPSSWADDL